MRFSVGPLEGKYYGTDICDQGRPIAQVWIMGDGEPSHRELGEDPEPEFCDSHYETRASLALAEAMVDGLNEFYVYD